MTTSLAIMGLIALTAILYGSPAGEMIGLDFGIVSHLPFLAHHAVADDSHIAALLVRFDLSLRSQHKRSAMALECPGCRVVTVTLEVASTLPLRFYQNRFSSQRIYGGLNAVVDLLLWLYFTGAAIFIGGEAHSEIEKSAAEALRSHVGGSAERRSGGKER